MDGWLQTLSVKHWHWEMQPCQCRIMSSSYPSIYQSLPVMVVAAGFCVLDVKGPISPVWKVPSYLLESGDSSGTAPLRTLCDKEPAGCLFSPFCRGHSLCLPPSMAATSLRPAGGHWLNETITSGFAVRRAEATALCYLRATAGHSRGNSKPNLFALSAAAPKWSHADEER